MQGNLPAARLASALHALLLARGTRMERRDAARNGETMKLRVSALLLAVMLFGSVAGASPARTPVRGSVSPRVAEATDDGREPASAQHQIVVGLELRNRDALEAFLQDVQDPSSSRYGHFLTPPELTPDFAPPPRAAPP